MRSYLDNPASLGDAVGGGNGILGHVLGSKDVSRQVATQAARQTGLDVGILKQALPLVAAMMMGRCRSRAAVRRWRRRRRRPTAEGCCRC